MGGVVYQIGRIGKRKTQPPYAKLCIRLYKKIGRKKWHIHFSTKRVFIRCFVVVVSRPQYALYITVHKKYALYIHTVHAVGSDVN